MTEPRGEKQEISVLEARIRSVLLEDRDPIGIRNVPEARDEYDQYADEISAMLATGHATVIEIAAYLFLIATEHMALGARPESGAHSRAVAQRLVSVAADQSRSDERNGFAF